MTDEEFTSWLQEAMKKDYEKNKEVTPIAFRNDGIYTFTDKWQKFEVSADNLFKKWNKI